MGEAKEYCWSIGGYLAEIMTAEEERLLDNYLVSGISYWIGLSDIDHEGTSQVTKGGSKVWFLS